jgi:CHAT domain-containing protein
MRGSRLLLAPEDSTDGGFLTAERIAGLRLGNLRLAILSACQTLSRREGGSYSYDGLAEAFLAAGAGGVIGSLWAIDDETTTRLMARLHRELAAGLAPAEALRSAQLAALREPGGGTTGLPTWAAFRYITR